MSDNKLKPDYNKGGEGALDGKLSGEFIPENPELTALYNKLLACQSEQERNNHLQSVAPTIADLDRLQEALDTAAKKLLITFEAYLNLLDWLQAYRTHLEFLEIEAAIIIQNKYSGMIKDIIQNPFSKKFPPKEYLKINPFPLDNNLLAPHLPATVKATHPSTKGVVAETQLKPRRYDQIDLYPEERRSDLEMSLISLAFRRPNEFQIDKKPALEAIPTTNPATKPKEK